MAHHSFLALIKFNSNLTFGAFENSSHYNLMFKIELVNLERQRSTGGDLENAPCRDIFPMKMKSNDEIVCGDITNNQKIKVLK